MRSFEHPPATPKLLLACNSGIALASIGLGAGGASADVFVFADIFKFKDKFVFEDIDKFKFVDIFVDVFLDANQAAEAEAIANQDNFGNFVDEGENETTDDIFDSVNGNEGVTSVNQSAGDINNQGTAISFAEATGGSSFAFADAQASASQFNEFNEVVSGPDEFRTASIAGSINENTGVTTVNQAPGVLSNQLNAIAVAVAGDFGVALSEADLGQFSDDNFVDQFFTDYSATISSSVNNNSGVTAVNQSAGNMANQANVLAVSAAGTF